jgi:cation:H+ antiporter
MWLFILLIFVGGIALWLGAENLVEGAARLAKRFGLSDLVIGLTIVAIGTSAPEFAVTLTAAIDGKSAVSLGNIVGSNIFNIGIILGGVALFGSIHTARRLVYRDTSILLISSLALIGFTLDNKITQLEGAFFFSALLIYIFMTLKAAIITKKSEESSTVEWKIIDMIRLIGGLILVILGAHLLVDNAVALAQHFRLSEWLIGVTIVAIGTSLPELATSTAAAVRGKLGLSAGNLVGSDIFNVLGVLGITALLNPLDTNIETRSDLFMMSIHVAVVLFFLRTGWKLKPLEGAILVLLGLARWGLSFA